MRGPSSGFFTTNFLQVVFQGEVAQALGTQRSRVVVKVKRIGGGFGGKESAAGLLAAPTAWAAQRFS